MWTIKELREWPNETLVNGKWVPARPLNWRHRSLLQRIKEAIAVFFGRAESFVWSEEQ